MKRLLAFILAGAMVFAASACSNNNAAPTQPPAAESTADNSSAPTDAPATSEAASEPVQADASKELNIFLATTPETIDPNLGSALDSGNYSNHTFEGLMRYKWDGSGVEPGMAESYTVSDDGLVWTFKLRDSLWSDGQPVTADDFVYSWRRLVDPDTAAPYAVDMGAFIKNGMAVTEGQVPKEDLGVSAIDQKTLEVTLENPCPFFEQIAAFATFSPIRQDTVEANGDNWTKTAETFISNGPFKMESYATDDKMVIVPNPGYWDAASVVPEKINFLFLSDDNAALAAFRSGELDYQDVPPEEEVLALKNDGFYGDTPENGTYYISFNTQKAPLDNVLVRKALTLAVDTQFIADTVRNGNVKPAEAFIGDGFYTSGHSEPFRGQWQTYVSPSKYEENKALAQQALADAGYPGGEGFPKLSYLYNTNSTHAVIGEALQDMWKNVLGIEIELRSAEWATVLQDRRNGNFDISRNGWIADYNDPVTMLNLFTSTSGNNDGKYSSAEYDAKIEASNRETDPAKRDQLLHEAEDILLGQDWALAPIYYYTISWAINPALKDWGVTPLGYKFFQKAYKE
ncbi:MAG: peptide ABC transporter substrate-binding protein [Clostridiales bacterium]|jgi:ABC-type oligopeptide transport system substrate-binding subunit|nr:peptide ABC transporter substrate-binding protein [Clostridiales bacterium]